MNLNYIGNIPFATNDPSDDQPDMQTNTNSIGAWVTQDHYGFNDNRGGTHKQVRLNSLPAIPAGLTANFGTLYSKLVNTSVGNEPTEFYTPANTGNEYQLTRTITGQFTTFGTNTAYDNTKATQFGGWTFLPGGLLFQYASYTPPSPLVGAAIQVAVTFSVPFTTGAYSINLTVIGNNLSSVLPRPIISIVNGSVSLTGFTVLIWNIPNNAGASYQGFYWTAIGV